MDLNTYIRIHLNNKWTKLVIKDKCEQCNATENLELHHVDRFIKLLDDTLVLLDMEYKDTKEYTENELMKIRLVMQGLHLEIKTKTLCLTCHNSLHKKEDAKVVPKLGLRKIKSYSEITQSEQNIMDILIKVQENKTYRETLIQDGMINERGFRKQSLRELCGLIGHGRTTFSTAMKKEPFQEFLKERDIIVPEKGHYITIKYKGE